MRKQEEFRELTNRDLRERLIAEKSELLQLRLDHSITPLDNSSLIKEKRRDIARLKTEIRAREIKTEELKKSERQTEQGN